MHSSLAARQRLLAVTLMLSAALPLAACGSVDDALFGNGAQGPAAANAPKTPALPGPTQEQQFEQTTEAVSAGENPAVTPPAPGDLGITLPTIEPASSTGTPVGQTVDRIRTEMTTLQSRVAADLQQFQGLQGSAAQDTTTYQEAKSHIIIRLQVGTTKGNPELVNEWNTGQSALDSLTGNINSLAAAATDLSSAAQSLATERVTISDTGNMAGAVDEDHRQLSVLGDDAAQLEAAVGKLEKAVARDIQRQTAFVANERGGLAKLADAIRSGELYPVDEVETAPATASLSPTAATMEPSGALVTIRFDHPHVDFEKTLYDALNQALQSKPSASFRVVAVTPTGGTETAMQIAQRDAEYHARDILKSMTDMGVPAARVAISSATDPSVSATEVRVYVK